MQLSTNRPAAWFFRLDRLGAEDYYGGIDCGRAAPAEILAATKGKRWSQHVTDTSNALDLERGVFTKKDPKAIARSLKRSAEQSRRRKSSPYRSAMSMLTFYINRAGKTLPKIQRERLESAKDELRKLYARPAKS